MLRFTPTAWAKLQFFCHRGETEIGGFGVSSPDDLLLVEEFVTVKQRCSAASVAFDDQAIADFYDEQVDLGRKPSEFSRIWLHTHPGDSPNPSFTDEETFRRVFGGCDWAIMFILARTGKTYARLRFNVGPGGQMLIPVEVDYSESFPATDHEAWALEYAANVECEYVYPSPTAGIQAPGPLQQTLAALPSAAGNGAGKSFGGGGEDLSGGGAWGDLTYEDWLNGQDPLDLLTAEEIEELEGQSQLDYLESVEHPGPDVGGGLNLRGGNRTMNQDNTKNPFEDAPVIYSYSRKQAIEDGVLVDLTPWSKDTGFKIPVACTSAVWHGYITPREGTKELGQSERGRAHDVMWMLFCAIRAARSPGDQILYKVIFLMAPGKQETVTLKSICGPGDDGEPVITIMNPDED